MKSDHKMTARSLLRQRGKKGGGGLSKRHNKIIYVVRNASAADGVRGERGWQTWFTPPTKKVMQLCQLGIPGDGWTKDGYQLKKVLLHLYFCLVCTLPSLK